MSAQRDVAGKRLPKQQIEDNFADIKPPLIEFGERGAAIRRRFPD